MGDGTRKGAGSQPVPDPYQAQGYATGQVAPQRHYAAQPAPGAGYGSQGAYGNPGAQGAYGQAGGRAGYGQPDGRSAYGQAGGQAGAQAPAGQMPQGYTPHYGMAQAGAGQAAYVAPATSRPQQAPRRRRGPAFWIGIVVAILCIIAACLLALSMCGGQSKRAGEAGQLEGKTEAEIQAELDRQVEEGMFNISIASTVQFETSSSEGEFRIENVPGNPYLMQVAISRDDTGDEIYRTDMIEPNHHIQRDTLDAELEPGTYECTATFFACDPQTEDVVGQAAAKMIVIVNG